MEKKISRAVSAESPWIDDEIDLARLWDFLWSARVKVLAVTLLFVTGAAVYAFLQDKVYRAEAVLMRAESRQSNSPLASQLGSAAALIGINVGQDTNSQVTSALAILRSREFAAQFLRKHNLLPMLMASEWSDSEEKNVIDPELFDEATGVWLMEGDAPSDLMAHNKLSSILTVTTEPSSGLIRLAIEWTDPVQAAQWVNWLVEDINKHVKERDVKEAESAIEYLRLQLDSTQLVEMQNVFYQLIETQTRVIMLADVRDEYVFQIIDPAVLPEWEVSPNRPLILVVGMLAGLLTSILSLVLVSSMASSRKLLMGASTRATTSH